MRRVRLSLEEAFEREAEGLLTIYCTRKEAINEFPQLPMSKWLRNYDQALVKYSKVSVDYILDYINCKYEIELELPYEPETNTYG